MLHEERTKRYQSRYLCLKYNDSIDGSELLSFLASKGLDLIGVYVKNSEEVPETIVFLVFDKPRDFFYNTQTEFLAKPRYLLHGGISPELIRLDGKEKFYEYHSNLVDKMFENGTHYSFFDGVGKKLLNSKRKDKDYFINLTKKAIEKMEKPFFESLILDFKYFVSDVEKQMESINNLLPTLAEKDRSLLALTLPIKSKEITTTVNKIRTNQLQQPKEKSVVNNQPPYPVDSRPVEKKLKKEQINYDEFNNILKNDLVSPENFNKIDKLQLDLKPFIESFIRDNKINFRSCQLNMLRIYAMDTKLKSMPKKGDTNKWLCETYDKMNNRLKSIFFKYTQ